MPGLGGFELADRLHVGRPSLRVVYVTGYVGGGHDGAPAREMVPSRRLLEKPFSSKQLLAEVRAALEEG